MTSNISDKDQKDWKNFLKKNEKLHNKDLEDKENKFHMGILLHPEKVPINSWSILLSDGKIVHADETEIEVVRESEDR